MAKNLYGENTLSFNEGTNQEGLNPQNLTKAFIYATDWLGVYVDEINALNVYPVPDGDTGTNMHLTMQSVRGHLSERPIRTMNELAHALSLGSLMGARGNSGVILSQVLKGFAEVIKEKSQVDVATCIKALKNATKSAYGSVSKPVEGTILTVVRRSAEGVEEHGFSHTLEVLKKAYDEAKQALEETPKMLPILKQAGVVDSGGLGFLRVLEGIIAAFEDKELPTPPKVTQRAQEQFAEEEFGFCTEFLISQAQKTAAELQAMVAPYGDSLLVVGAEGFIKGHIHTEEPEKLLALVARQGKLVASKVEDMSQQHSEILDNVDPKDIAVPQNGLVAVSSGYGITKVFRNLGVRVVGGGQTNNPSVEDIADAVRSVPADNVIILPNNKNIILAAQRVSEVVADKNIHIIPTRTLGQGLAAAVVFEDNADIKVLCEKLNEAAENAFTLEVTTASRTVNLDGVEVKEGQFIGLVNNELKVSDNSPEACLKAMLSDVANEMEVATLFYNSALEISSINKLVSDLEEGFAALEIEVHAGSPDLYDFLMLLE